MQLSEHTYTVPNTHWLYGVPWTKSGAKFGASFHRSYADAKKYISNNSNSELKSSSPKMVRVSDWLADWVHEYGDYWAPINFLSEAVNYEPTLH